MATTVTIQVWNDLVSPDGVEGVLVRVNEADGTFVTDGVTNADGEITFVLPAASYDLLFYKPLFSCAMKRLVVEDGDPEIWRVTGHIYQPPESADTNLCRVSGYFIGVTGHPARDAKMIFSTQAELTSLNDAVLIPGSYFQISPDENGYVEFDLLRKVNYDVYLFNVPMLCGQMPPKIVVQVPDAPSAILGRLMFPVQVLAEFSEHTLDLLVGGESDDSVLTTITYSDGTVRALSPGWATVLAKSSDPLVAEVTTLDGKLVVRPMGVGTATITMERAVGGSVLYLPSTPEFTSDSLTVTVS